MSYEGVTLAKQLDDPRQELNMPARNFSTPLAVPVQTAFKVHGNIYEFNNSRLRAIVAEDNLQNTARFTNQTFQLRFRINRDFYYLGDYSSTSLSPSLNNSQGFSKNNGFTLNMTYLYNAVFLIGGDGGTTKLITN
jgi:hypothetical protein